MSQQISSVSRRHVALLAVILALAPTRSVLAATLESRKAKVKVMEQSVSKEALQRKQRSEVVLKDEGVPLNLHLPAIESEVEAKRRSREEIAHRALTLIAIAMRAEGMDQETAQKVVREYDLESHLSPKEKEFLAQEMPSDHDRVQFFWRYEAAYTLLWALGYVGSLGKPEKRADLAQVIPPMKKRKTKQFIAEAELRSLSAILDQADLIYRYRWAIVDAQLSGETTPANLNPDVALERHVALNWLVGYMDQEWDDVSTDT